MKCSLDVFFPKGNKIGLNYCHSCKNYIFAAVTKLYNNVRHRNKSKKDHR